MFPPPVPPPGSGDRGGGGGDVKPPCGERDAKRSKASHTRKSEGRREVRKKEKEGTNKKQLTRKWTQDGGNSKEEKQHEDNVRRKNMSRLHPIQHLHRVIGRSIHDYHKKKRRAKQGVTAGRNGKHFYK